ncbi:MAG: SDR family NAD(P)-dependent oxidoreductase [Burkholderiaceae bacterium]
MALLDGHIALVSGAARGIGRAIATGYAKEGAHLVLTDLDEQAVQQTAAEIRELGGKADAFGLDVTQRSACDALAVELERRVGQVSVLVNNAGITRRTSITGDAGTVQEDWDAVLAVNLNGAFNLTHALLPGLRARRGRIINIASIQAFVHLPVPTSIAYTASKHGVLGMTRALAAELGKEGVRVNAIGPGIIETAINADTRSKRPEAWQKLIEHTPLGRPGRPEDIVGPAVFLASDLSEFVTGSIVMVDGGYRVV